MEPDDTDNSAVPDTQKADFFISYTQADRRWAEWIAWQLQGTYRVIIQAWDFAPGTNFLAKMDEALQGSGRTLLVLTPAALSSRYVREEWTAALQQERLVPVRVVEFDPAGLLGARSYIDLVGLDEDGARERLIESLKPPTRPDTTPAFPGHDAVSEPALAERPTYPGALPPAAPTFQPSEKTERRIEQWAKLENDFKALEAQVIRTSHRRRDAGTMVRADKEVEAGSSWEIASSEPDCRRDAAALCGLAGSLLPPNSRSNMDRWLDFLLESGEARPEDVGPTMASAEQSTLHLLSYDCLDNVAKSSIRGCIKCQTRDATR